MQVRHEGRIQHEVNQPDVPVVYEVESHDDDFLILKTHKEGRMVIATKHLLEVTNEYIDNDVAVFCNVNDVENGKLLAMQEDDSPPDY